jgi:hypothetical protein
LTVPALTAAPGRDFSVSGARKPDLEFSSFESLIRSLCYSTLPFGRGARHKPYIPRHTDVPTQGGAVSE